MQLAKSKIHFVDVGTSGGVLGLERGYCQMIGGENDDRRAPGSDFRNARPGRRAAVGRRARRARYGGAGLSALRRQRRWPLREDGPQRHRVRADGGLRGRLQHPQARQHRAGSQGRRGCRNRAARRAAPVPVLVRCGAGRRSVAPRQHHHLAVAGSDRRGAGARSDAGRLRRAGLRFRRGPLDRRGRDRGGRAGACPDARRCMRASSRAVAPSSPTRCSRPCAWGLAATSRPRAEP